MFLCSINYIHISSQEGYMIFLSNDIISKNYAPKGGQMLG